MHIMIKMPEIKIVDEIPCIVINDGPSRPSGPRDIKIIVIDFTSIQNDKERQYFEEVNKELKKLFSD